MNPSKIFTWILAGLFLILGIIPCQAGSGRLDLLARQISKQDALLVTAPDGKILFSKNPDKPLTPASILKIWTALSALHYLGPEFRFHTEFYQDQTSAGLKVKGYGDPLWVSEVISEMARRLFQKIKKVDDIVLDDTFFTQPILIPGITDIPTTNPYDAPNGALCANFNTISFAGRGLSLASAEPQTPLLPFARPRIQASKLTKGRIILAHQNHESTFYAGHLLRHFAQDAGVGVTGTIRRGKVTAADRLLLRLPSPFTLRDALTRLMQHSSNFIANQLFFVCGARHYQEPATLAKGIAALQAFGREAAGIQKLTVVEGSGLSRRNQVTAREMDRALVLFDPFKALMRHEGREYFKTGSLNGVRTRAGYIQAANGGYYRFVLMLNTPGKDTGPVMRHLKLALE